VDQASFRDMYKVYGVRRTIKKERNDRRECGEGTRGMEKEPRSKGRRWTLDGSRVSRGGFPTYLLCRAVRPPPSETPDVAQLENY